MSLDSEYENMGQRLSGLLFWWLSNGGGNKAEAKVVESLLVKQVSEVAEMSVSNNR